MNLNNIKCQEKFDEKKYPCIRYILGDVRDGTKLNQALRDA